MPHTLAKHNVRCPDYELGAISGAALPSFKEAMGLLCPALSLLISSWFWFMVSGPGVPHPELTIGYAHYRCYR